MAEKLSETITNLMCPKHMYYAIERSSECRHCAEHWLEAMLKAVDNPLRVQEQSVAMSIRLGVALPVCCMFGDDYLKQMFDWLHAEEPGYHG